MQQPNIHTFNKWQGYAEEWGHCG